MSYSYSTNEENYYGDFATPEEAALDCLTDGDRDRCWVGFNEAPPSPESYFDIEDLIETVSCQDLYSGEWADNWFHGTKEQRQEINNEVQRVIGAWLDKHELRPAFHNVVNAVEWTLIDGKPTKVA
jgi:hypothetical protein